MKSIGICIVISANDSFNKVVYFIENIVSKSKLANFNTYIYANGCNDIVKNYLQQVSNSLISESENPKRTDNFIYSEFENNIYYAYNKLFVLVNEDFICLMPLNIIVNDFWYSNLLSCYETINGSGILSVRTGKDNVYYTSTLSEGENLKTIIKPIDEDDLRGLYFMKTSIVKVIGGFDKNLFNTGCELKELCWRFRKNGYMNYYVTEQNCIDVSDNFKHNVDTDKYKSLIKEKINNKVYKAQF